MDEDCLFLNIARPSSASSICPVVVWFHGGGFVAGSANEYDGSVLARQGDVVVVTVNSRLGPFGFLDLSHFGVDYVGSASNGIRDQILALRWISENIEDYGGDPANVTIVGQSSGGSSVLGLLACPAADGFYQKAVACSPTAAYSRKTHRAEDLAERLNCSENECLDVLLSMPAIDLVALKLGARITVDGSVITRSTFEAIADRGKFGVPLITGTTATEGTLYTKGKAAAHDHYPGLNQYLARDMLCGDSPHGYLEALRAAYPEATPGSFHEMVWTDMFRRIALTAAELSTVHGVGGWLYRFDLPVNHAAGDYVGVPHASDMSFVFNSIANSSTHAYSFHDRSDAVVQHVALAWSNVIVTMARTGTPNGSGMHVPVWPRYEPESRNSLLINERFIVSKDVDSKHLPLWS